MSEQNKEIIRRWYDEVWNNQKGELIDELMDPDARAHGLGPEPIEGRELFRQFYNDFKNTYSDIEVTRDKTLTDGDYVVSMCTVKAKHKDTGKPVAFIGTSITEVKNGKIVQGWNYFDFLSVHLQTGKIQAEQLV